MQALADALGWPAVIKTLSFHSPAIPALAGLLLKRQPDGLDPPWPDLIICAEALPSIIARRLRNRSGGRIKTVCLGRPAGTTAAFDLVLTTAQYRLPPAENIVELPMPLSANEMAGVAKVPPRSHIALLVGAASFPDRLDPKIAAELAAAVRWRADEHGGTIIAMTGPRTDAAVAAALIEALPAPHQVHVFGSRTDDPYRDVLAGAREIVVTSDSVSMVADALETSRPVYVYPLPQVLNLEWRLSEWLYRHAVVKPSPLLWPVSWLFNAGVIEVSADRRQLFGRLAASRRLSWFGASPPVPQSNTTQRDLDLAVTRVRRLLA
jgi:mitochondrial fission protein ELM1